MKIGIYPEEMYPVYTILEPSELDWATHNIDVPEDVVKHWKEVYETFVETQAEIETALAAQKEEEEV